MFKIRNIVSVAFLFVFQLAVGQKTNPTHHVPVDKNLSEEWFNGLWNDDQRVYRGNELKTIGMPCGGIGAGQLYVRGDGTLACWWIANNAFNTGYGITPLMDFPTALGPWKVCYQTFTPFSYIDQGFAISVEQHGRTIKRELSKKDFDHISFIGEYPIAKVNYADKANPLPVEINAEIFSPFIPLNAKESATPGTILKYTIKNTTDAAVNISLTGWLQNMVCLSLQDEIVADSRNRVLRNGKMTSVTMDLVRVANPEPVKRDIELFEDFESGEMDKWKPVGSAFASGPVKAALADQSQVTGYEGNYFVNSYKGGDSATGKLISIPFTLKKDFILFNIGGGSHKNQTCFNLVVNGKVVRSATGENVEKLKTQHWDVKEFRGQQAHFEVVDAATGGWGHVNVDHILFSSTPTLKTNFFPEHHPYFGNISLSVLSDRALGDADFKGEADDQATALAKKKTGQKLVGAAGTSFHLGPNESKEVTFLLTWYFPNRPKNYGDGGNWTKPIPTDGPAVGNMYANWFDGSMDVALWLENNLPRLSEATHKFHDAYYKHNSLPYWLIQRIMMPVSTLATETCQWWATDKFWAWEGVGSCVGTCTHVWNYEQALARLFPRLERNIREKTDFATSFQEDGGILARNGWGGILIDGQAGTILKSYREHLQSKDYLFLSRNWSKIKKAMQFLMNEDGNEDGLIEKSQANTYDIAFYGANTYVGGLYLAALKAAAQMAKIMRDTTFEKECLRIFNKGRQLTMEKLWNGEYFIQDVDLKKHPKFQYADGCLSDQLFAQTWAHLIDLGYIYPENNTKTALESIWKYNWAPDVGAQNKYHAPERTFADFGEAGLFVCTWPESEHLGEDGVRYRDEVWTGIEYQVATSMIYNGFIKKGLSLIKGLDNRYRPEKHNPWNEVECGDHYARALASWGVLLALEGYFYNGPEGMMRLAPRVQQGDFEGFFTAAEGWGNFSQTRQSGKQSNVVNVKYGEVRLKSLEVETVGNPEKVVLFFNGKEIPCDYKMQGDRVVVEFKEQVLREGQDLKVVLEV